MPRRSFKTELAAIEFILSSDARISAAVLGTNVLNDLRTALVCCTTERVPKYLSWSLLIGRSLDTFTVFFLSEKGEPPVSRFDPRIRRICNSSRPLTTNPAIQSDLLKVKDMRNNLFHNAGVYLNKTDMEDFIFSSTRCIQQLMNDL